MATIRAKSLTSGNQSAQLIHKVAAESDGAVMTLRIVNPGQSTATASVYISDSPNAPVPMDLFDPLIEIPPKGSVVISCEQVLNDEHIFVSTTTTGLVVRLVLGEF